MSIVILQTTPELEGCSDPAYFKKGEIKKAKVVQGGFTIYHKGGIMAGYTPVSYTHLIPAAISLNTKSPVM